MESWYLLHRWGNWHSGIKDRVQGPRVSKLESIKVLKNKKQTKKKRCVSLSKKRVRTHNPGNWVLIVDTHLCCSLIFSRLNHFNHTSGLLLGGWGRQLSHSDVSFRWRNFHLCFCPWPLTPGPTHFPSFIPWEKAGLKVIRKSATENRSHTACLSLLFLTAHPLLLCCVVHSSEVGSALREVWRDPALIHYPV